MTTTETLKANHQDLMNAHYRLNEHNDCAVISAANVLGISYDESHGLHAYHGRRRRCGTRLSISRKVLSAKAQIIEHPIVRCDRLGYRYGLQTPTVAQFIRTLDKSKRYWLVCTGHAFAYVNGQLLDNIMGSRMRARMKYCFEIVLPVADTMTQADINAMWARLDALEGKKS